MTIDRETETIIAALLAYDTYLADQMPNLPNRMKAMALALKAAGETKSADAHPAIKTVSPSQCSV